MLDLPLFYVFPLALLIAGAMDVLTMTIPNRICLAFAAAFIVAAPAAGMPLDQVFNHVLTGIAVLALGIAMFSMGLMGGGDAKLIAAASLWIGGAHMMEFIVYVAIAGGVLAVVLLFYRRLPLLLFRMPEWVGRLHQSGFGMPYGVAIAAGGLAIYPKLFWFTAFSS
jgi:prepilin peptidase CpaA